MNMVFENIPGWGTLELCNVPDDYLHPNWSKCVKCHDWKNHVGRDVQIIWSTFSDMQKAVLATDAEDRADNENWD